MVDRDVVARRILALNEAVAHLRRSGAGDEARLQSEALLRAATERWMQVAIEACIDLAFHVIADRGLPAPPSARAAFRLLAAEGLIDAPLGERLGDAVSIRNVLVHDYVGVNLGMLARAVRDDLADLEALAAAIGRLL